MRRRRGDQEETIRTKIRRLLRANRAFFEESTLTLLAKDTAQLQSLRIAEPHLVETTSSTDEDTGTHRNQLTRYDIAVHDQRFLQLDCEPAKFYVRKGYQELYDNVEDYWKSRNHYRVLLLGNNGTGKSWFQVYALKQLMSYDHDNREYDMVIRHFESDFFYLIDLEEAKVYLWDISPNSLEAVAQAMQRTLYFYEPGEDVLSPPLDVALSSLSTLTPYSLIHQYQKDLCRIVYLWPWTSGELRDLIQDSKLDIDETTFLCRYYKFGGVISHVLGQDASAEQELREQLICTTMNLQLFNSPLLNRDQHNHVSGFLVCYDNRSSEGKDRFAKNDLEYTSAHVEECVQEAIEGREVNEIMQNVLNRLAGCRDIAGKNLQRVARELLAQGREFKWQRIEIGANQVGWEIYQVEFRRNIIIADGLSENFHQPGNIIAPKDPTFPVVDFVFSFPPHKSPDAPPIVAFQCTWRKSHHVKLKALYALRRNHLKIPDTQVLEIYMVCPRHEVVYANRMKEQFLEGKLDSPELQRLWDNTKLFVIRPESSWEGQINTFRSNH